MPKNEINFNYKIVRLRQNPISNLDNDRAWYRDEIRSALRTTGVSMAPLALGLVGLYLTRDADSSTQLVKPLLRVLSCLATLSGASELAWSAGRLHFWNKKLRESLRTPLKEHIKERLRRTPSE